MSRLTTLLKAQRKVRIVESDSLFEEDEYACCVVDKFSPSIHSVTCGKCHRFDCVTSAVDRCYLNSTAGIDRLEDELCQD